MSAALRPALRPLSRLWPVLLASGLLLGCTADHGELQLWMDQQRREVKPNVPPLTPPKKFDPQPYAASDAVDPFSTQKLAVALKRDERAPSSLLAAELKRRKEPLEAYPLDSMSMVGSLNKQGMPYALLRVEGLLYQVKAGDYLGQNYGRILKVSETELVLREVVQDAAGEWIERNTSLQLIEQRAGR
jgi:type IV pilus assembly protein PilP